MIQRQNVQAVREVLICDHCGSEMKATGIMKTCDPPKIEHACCNCGLLAYPNNIFPRVTYVDVPLSKQEPFCGNCRWWAADKNGQCVHPSRIANLELKFTKSDESCLAFQRKG